MLLLEVCTFHPSEECGELKGSSFLELTYLLPDTMSDNTKGEEVFGLAFKFLIFYVLIVTFTNVL